MGEAVLIAAQSGRALAQAADRTGRAADHVLTAATALTRQSEELAAEVHRFLAGVRAA